MDIIYAVYTYYFDVEQESHVGLYSPHFLAKFSPTFTSLYSISITYVYVLNAIATNGIDLFRQAPNFENQ